MIDTLIYAAGSFFLTAVGLVVAGGVYVAVAFALVDMWRVAK